MIMSSGNVHRVPKNEIYCNHFYVRQQTHELFYKLYYELGEVKDIRLWNEQLREVLPVRYLGSKITTDCRSNVNVKTSLARTRNDYRRGEIFGIKHQSKRSEIIYKKKHLFGDETWNKSGAEATRDFWDMVQQTFA